MTFLKEIQVLLKQIETINHAYRDALQDPRYQFNIITILWRANDEVSFSVV
jgi:hypothetical protein